MNPTVENSLTHPLQFAAGHMPSSETSIPNIQQVSAETQATLESIKSQLSEIQDLKGKKSLMQFINAEFIDKKNIKADLFKDIYAEISKGKKSKISDALIVSKLSKSSERDQMFLSIFRDPSIWPKDFLEDRYKSFLKKISDTTCKDEAYSIIGKHCDDVSIKIKIAKKIQDNTKRDTYIIDVLKDSLRFQDTIDLVESISTQDGKDQAYCKLSQWNDSPQEALKFIKNIQNDKLKQESCLHWLKRPDLSASLQLEIIELIPDQSSGIDGIHKDGLLLAIAQNPNFASSDRYGAFTRLGSNVIQAQVLETFDKDPSVFDTLLSEAKLSEKISHSLLNFYFFNKKSIVRQSFDDLLKIASELYIRPKQAYLDYKILLSDADQGFISLALDLSFSIDDRYKAFQKITNVRAIEVPAIRTFLQDYLSQRPNALTAQFHHFELLSIADFRSDIALLLLPKIQDALTLYGLIRSYHVIPKGNKSHFEDRIKLLNEVTDNAKRIIESLNNNEDSLTVRLQYQQIQSLKNIQAQAELKAYYIKKIPGLKQKALDRVSRSAQPKYSLPKDLSVLNVLGDISRNLDPLKREGLYKFLEIWEETIKNNPQTSNFWLWLDSQNIPDLEQLVFKWTKNPILDNTEPSGLGQDERYSLWTKEEKRVQFQAGVAYNSAFGNNNENQRLEGDYIYNIGQDGQLYILPYYTAEDIKLTHDTILKGNNILSAGIVKFEKGKLVHIDVASGHYAPHRFHNLQPALAYFLEKNPGAIHPDTLVGDYKAHHPTDAYAIFKDMRKPAKQDPREKITMQQLGFKSQKPSSLT